MSSFCDDFISPKLKLYAHRSCAITSTGESCGLAVEHSAYDRKVVGSIPVQSNARWKWCQSHARLIAGTWLNFLDASND